MGAPHGAPFSLERSSMPLPEEPKAAYDPIYEGPLTARVLHLVPYLMKKMLEVGAAISVVRLENNFVSIYPIPVNIMPGFHKRSSEERLRMVEELDRRVEELRIEAQVFLSAKGGT